MPLRQSPRYPVNYGENQEIDFNGRPKENIATNAMKGRMKGEVPEGVGHRCLDLMEGRLLERVGRWLWLMLKGARFNLQVALRGQSKTKGRSMRPKEDEAGVLCP